MKVCGVYVGGGKGATMYEFQIGRAQVSILHPRFMVRRNWPFIRFRWPKAEG